MASPDGLRTVEVGFGQFHWEGIDIWMLLGNFQLWREKEEDAAMSDLIKDLTKHTTILTLHGPLSA